MLLGWALAAGPLPLHAAPEIPPDAAINHNRHAAGRLEGGVLRITLEARAVSWRPLADQGPALAVEAFGEAGKSPSIPGPLIRVPEGTEVRALVRNRLDHPLTLQGFHSRPGRTDDTVTIAPHAEQELRFAAGAPGAYYYSAATTPYRSGGRPLLRDGLLNGALIVEPRGVRSDPDERIFVLGRWTEFAAADLPAADGPVADIPVTQIPAREIYVINGRAWPFTERLTYRQGQRVRWTVLNPSAEFHPMHLHGFDFDLLAQGDGEHETVLGVARREFTEGMIPGATMRVAWTPDRPGNWLFHCHFLTHIAAEAQLHAADAMAGMPGMRHGADGSGGMSGLVMAIHVTSSGRPATAPPVSRRLTLYVQEEAGRFGAAPGRGYLLREGDAPAPDGRIELPGPPIVLTRGQTTQIRILNRMRTSTTVHWHGMSIDSYYDGVAGFGGDGTPGRTTPEIAPGGEFTVEMTPPRAGTFIYHTHAHDAVALASGLFGPLVVLEPGQVFDPAADRIFLISMGGPPAGPGFAGPRPLLLNGQAEPPAAAMKVGLAYRLRLINITGNNPGLRVMLKDASGRVVGWRALAKDANDLPSAEATLRPADQRISIGETFDFEIRPQVAGELVLQVRAGAGPLRNRQRIVVD